MAKLIEFYVPDGVKSSAKWLAPEQRGKLIPFPALQKSGAGLSPACDSVPHH